MCHAGNSLEHRRDFDDRGGRKTIWRLMEPSETFCRVSQITSMCLPMTKSGTRIGATAFVNVKKSPRDWVIIFSSKASRSCSFVVSSVAIVMDELVYLVFKWGVVSD